MSDVAFIANPAPRPMPRRGILILLFLCNAGRLRTTNHTAT